VDILKSTGQEVPINLEEMKRNYRQHGFEKVVFVSATQGENIQELKTIMFEEIRKKHIQIYPNYLKNGYEFSPDFIKDTQEEE
jgi:GTP-binding protein HflX